MLHGTLYSQASKKESGNRIELEVAGGRRPVIFERVLRGKVLFSWHEDGRGFYHETNVESFTAEKGHWQWPGGLL